LRETICMKQHADDAALARLSDGDFLALMGEYRSGRRPQYVACQQCKSAELTYYIDHHSRIRKLCEFYVSEAIRLGKLYLYSNGEMIGGQQRAFWIDSRSLILIICYGDIAAADRKSYEEIFKKCIGNIRPKYLWVDSRQILDGGVGSVEKMIAAC